ncbi:hypothetical protein RB195_017373 [Necator americanus]
MVVKFHNDKRRAVAHGEQANKAGTPVLSPANKMNALTWDCNLERFANDEAAKCVNYANNQFGINQATFVAGKVCDDAEKTREVLNKWWNEVTTIGLGNDQKYAAGLDNFANMVYEDTNAFACSFAKCSDNIRLLCLYNKVGNEANKVLYEKAATADVACDGCAQGSPCQAWLCQPPFTPAANDEQCADDGMTNDMTNTALHMHNYYRGLLGSGWADDKIRTYAPLPKAMPQLMYGCKDLAKEAADKAAACKETPDAPSVATRSQNHFTIKNVDIKPEDALKQAISTWWEELADIGVGDDTKYTDKNKNKLEHFANMAYDQTKSVGCSVKTCTKEGLTVVVCQYDQKIAVNTNIYEVAKSGNKACSGCDGKKCGTLEGLCVPSP